MAGIDKTYVKSWQDYCEIVDWCNSVGEVTDDYGKTFRPIDWVYQYKESEFNEYIDSKRNHILSFYNEHPEQISSMLDLTGYSNIEEYANGCAEILLWNTPEWFDYWLVRNCPIKTIQNRLNEQYSKDTINNIKKFNTKVDKYKRVQGSGRFKILSNHYSRMKYYGCRITVRDKEDYNWVFSKKNNTFFSLFDWKNLNDDDDQYYCVYVKKRLSMRKIRRLLKNWKLPAGTQIYFDAINNSLSIEAL